MPSLRRTPSIWRRGGRAVGTAGDLLHRDDDAAGGRRLEKVDAAQERRLARPRTADDRHHIARARDKVDALEHVERPEGLAQSFDTDRFGARGGFGGRRQRRFPPS
jgi:hypothetical protein